jgi:hypothetical protein
LVGHAPFDPSQSSGLHDGDPGCPAATAAQLPVAHVAHAPQDAVPQQVPPTQWVDAHWPSPVQPAPLPSIAEQLLLLWHEPPGMQFDAVVQLVGHELLDPLHTYAPQAAAVAPGEAFTHVPPVQLPHGPHAPLQQCPSAEQMPVLHCVAVLHELPAASCGVHFPLLQ